MNNNKPKVAFICVHNSCRSQMAEALGKHFASEVFESYSAGTETKPQINQDAVRLMKKIYNIDMEEKQYSKLITELPEIDIKITMGCNVICPFVDSKYEEDWGLDDPTGKSDEEFEKVITQIEKNIKELADKVSNHKLY
ncbi:MAG: ArsC family transcriptional regulator [Sedimentibacter sp.]|nr:ArsC family transcriptional regulator [Sedimentibacter sp.]